MNRRVARIIVHRVRLLVAAYIVAALNRPGRLTPHAAWRTMRAIHRSQEV